MKIFFLLFFVLLTSCKHSDECIIHFYLSGTASDKNGNPISDVGVYSMDDYGGGPTKWTFTDASGKFQFFRGSYQTLGNEYLVFKKSGYSDLSSPPLGKGSGTCGDQKIVRDATMETQ